MWVMRLKSKTIELIWSHDLDRFIEEHLGRRWSVQQDLMAGQDTIHTFEVFPDPTATAEVEAWLASPVPEYQTYGRDEVTDTGAILRELCNRALLDEGDLHIHVWW